MQQVRIVAEANANGDAATAIDLVFVYDPAVAQALPLSGPDWFARRSALRDGLGNALDVVSLQLPPGTVVEPELPGRHGHAIAVYGYADYRASAGQARMNLTAYTRVELQLGPASVAISGR